MTRPNIIIVLCDDLGYGDVGALADRAGVDRVPRCSTPRLDRMAAEGLVLEGLYCPAPVCAPSRASLLTGLSQGHCDLRDNSFDQALQDGPNLATVARQAGYATAAIGKWGLQGHGGTKPAEWPGFPTRRGFDTFYGYAGHADGHEHYPHDGLHRGAKRVWDGEEEVSADLAGCYTTDLFTARAKQWIIDHRDSQPDRPFLMYLAFDTPHAVTELPPCAYPTGSGLGGGLRWTGEPGRMINTADGTPDSWYHPDHAETGWPDVYRRYATSVRRIDDAVGDLLDLLADLDIDDDTIVWFTSDNGPSNESYLDEPLSADFFQSFGPFDGIKRDCWEGGVRVGGIVRGPGAVPPGRVTSDPAQFHDLLPTVCDLAGFAVPARADGVSLLPLLTGAGAHTPSTAYVEYSHDGSTPDFAVFEPSRRNRRRGQMQLIRIGDHVGVRYDIQTHDDPFEIYDVVTDPKQIRDLAGVRPDLQAQMHDEVLRKRVPHPKRPRPYDHVPIPAVSNPPVVTRVQLSAYAGCFPWVPQLDDLTPQSVQTIDHPGTGEHIPAGIGALRYSGYLEVREDSVCTFTVGGTEGALLRVHRAGVVDTGSGSDGADVTGGLVLARGLHPYELSVRGHRPPRFTWRASPVGDG